MSSKYNVKNEILLLKTARQINTELNVFMLKHEARNLPFLNPEQCQVEDAQPYFSHSLLPIFQATEYMYSAKLLKL